MKTPMLLELPFPAAQAPRPAPLRLRAQLPALTHAPTRPPPRPARAAHDFLVPNPRPDLTTDAHLLLMLEAG
jgi:hypothetical protein